MVNFNMTYWPEEYGPDCWGGDYDYYVDCQMEREAGGDAYYSWGDDSYYWDYYSWDGSYYYSWSGSGDMGDYWYYYGDDWSIKAALDDDGAKMAA